MLINSGTPLIVAPVDSVAGLVPPFAVSPSSPDLYQLLQVQQNLAESPQSDRHSTESLGKRLVP